MFRLSGLHALWVGLLCAMLASVATAQSREQWVTPAVRAPGVTQQFFDSAAAGARVSYHVYLPEAYHQQGSARFPVLYWLHGTGGGLQGIAPLAEWFDGAIRAGKIPPMLVVFPNGLPANLWCNSKDGRKPVETIVIRELLPRVDTIFRTVATRDGRIIEGFSMGGYGAARLGFRYPELFGSVSILAGGPLDLDFRGPRAEAKPAERQQILEEVCGGDMGYFRAQSPLTLAEQNAAHLRGRSRVRIAVGDRDFTAEANSALGRRLSSLGIAHDLVILPGVGHSPMPLLKGLGARNWEFYKKSFARETSP